jgi:hypothetical protein
MIPNLYWMRGRVNIQTSDDPLTLCIEHALDFVETGSARFFPAQVGSPAEITGPRENSIRMEAGVLVQWDDIGGMGGAEYMAAVTAMMTS